MVQCERGMTEEGVVEQLTVTAELTNRAKMNATM